MINIFILVLIITMGFEEDSYPSTITRDCGPYTIISRTPLICPNISLNLRTAMGLLEKNYVKVRSKPKVTKGQSHRKSYKIDIYH